MARSRTTFSFGQFEEFNLNSQLRFKANPSETTLVIVHELDTKELEASASYIQQVYGYSKLELVKSSTFEARIEEYDTQKTVVLILHLALDTEIQTHQKISALAFRYGLFQLNPYNKIAKLFDDKYLFYILMTANEVKQAKTINLPRTADLQIPIDLEEVIVKPRHGTEKIDTEYFGKPSLGLALIERIHKYDDAMIQEFIHAEEEYKITYMNGKFFARDLITNPALKNYLNELVDIIDNYSRNNKILMPGVFSLDILRTQDSFIVLEANIRPAGIYGFTQCLH